MEYTGYFSKFWNKGGEKRAMSEAKITELTHIMEHLTPYVVFYIGPIPITSTVVTTWVIMAILFVVAFICTRSLTLVPRRGRQHFIELFILFIWSVLETAMGREGRRFLPLVGTLFIFILFLNLAWFIPGLMPPTMDLSTTAAFGVTTIITVQLIGIANNGVGKYLKHFVSPSPALAPLNIVEELVKPVSLSLRLYGNMFGEKMVVSILAILVPLIVPVPVQLLGVLMAFIQAFVFTLLTTTYITTMVQGH